MSTLICLIPLLPLLAFVVNGLISLFAKGPVRAGGWFAVACMGTSALIGAYIFLGALGGGVSLPIQVDLWTWMSAGSLHLPIGFRVDQLTALMLFFVTFVSTLVFLYSMGYMEGERGFNRFFAYLGLFDFSMLVLVLGDSLPVLFVGWEGVGLCSYLLIGYYLAMPGAADAGKKAFIVNRIGDFGFLVAMFMIFYATGQAGHATLNMHEIVEAIAANQIPMLIYGGGFVTILTLAMFLGCTGKSAQIPLFVWLPDAMAGPTPVSALIHAATMVTAGIYLMVRMSALFALAPVTMGTVAVIAALTAFVAGTIGLTQRDIKKVLAYSTVSQLGYMFLACGVGAFTAGIFHVFTHAFFKACLFLGAGSVIHAAHHEQDLFLLGGLKKYMPKTRMTFLIACIAIAGVPPLAGFFSKDEILWQTFASGKMWLYLLGLLTALMTAIYSFRAYFMTFEGESRLGKHEHHDGGHDHKAADHGHHHGNGVHESPWTMTLPLIILAAGACIVGFLNLPPIFGGHEGVIGRFLEPIIEPAKNILTAHPLHEGGEHAHSPGLEWGLMILSVCIALAGIGIAYLVALKNWPKNAEKTSRAFGPLYWLSFNRWWWDDIYNVVFGGGLRAVAAISVGFDKYIIDGILHLLAWIARAFSNVVRGLQNGQVQAYAVAILFGVNLVIYLIFFYFHS